MELNISSTIKKFISALILLILPLIIILIGLIVNFLNAWYYIIAISWFGIGVIFYSALEQ